jgi:D-alanyl-D-alanine carboxypeptidase
MLVLVVGIMTAGCGSARIERVAALDRPELEHALQTLTRDGYSGAVATVRTPAGVWQGSAGYARGRRRARPDDRFAIASTTKTFVATAVLQLVQERRLSLHDSVERWLPALRSERRHITIRQLMNHTSGLPQDVALGGPPRYRLARVAKRPLLFRPGTHFTYSNSNYLALGLIIEKVTGQTLGRVLRDRIFRPLHLDRTSYGLPAEMDSDRTFHWLGPAEVSTGGDGGIVSTAGDLATFFGDLLGGKLLRRAMLAKMMRTVNTGSPERSGLGLFRFRLSCGLAWGHGGVQSAYSTMVLSARDGSRTAVVAQNAFAFDSVRSLAEQMYCF